MTALARQTAPGAHGLLAGTDTDGYPTVLGLADATGGPMWNLLTNPPPAVAATERQLQRLLEDYLLTPLHDDRDADQVERGLYRINFPDRPLEDPTAAAARHDERNTRMAGETVITVVGNLTADPELRYTPSGAAVANLTIASTPRTFDRQSGDWTDGDPLFLRSNIWQQAAEHAAETLTRGMRVIAQGRLRQRSFDTKEGEKRTVIELEIDEIGPSLKYATAKVTKVSRSGSSGGGASAAADDPWGSASPASSSGGGFSDEPPF